jgi:hypothetical protein
MQEIIDQCEAGQISYDSLNVAQSQAFVEPLTHK